MGCLINETDSRSVWKVWSPGCHTVHSKINHIYKQTYEVHNWVSDCVLENTERKKTLSCCSQYHSATANVTGTTNTSTITAYITNTTTITAFITSTTNITANY